MIKLLDKSVSYTVKSEKYGIERSTDADIKKNREKILGFKSEMVGMEMSKKAKVMRLGDDKKLDKPEYLWFRQKGMVGVKTNVLFRFR